ncbi:MAG: ABC transporter permease [Myxococcales bacterium]
MDRVLSETRYALRRIFKTPGFSAVVVLTLALGIGANSAIFSVVDAVLLQRLRYAEPDRLVTIRHYYPTLGPLEAPVSAPGFRDYRDRTQSFSGVAVEAGTAANLTGTGDPERVAATRVSGDWFHVLGVSPAIGRWIDRDDDVPGKYVAVISDAIWHRLFGASPDVLGKPLQLDGSTYTVVGVMPKGFRAFWSDMAEMWLPLSLPESDFERTNYTSEYLNVVARLRPGISAKQAQDEMTRFAQQVQKELPNDVGQAAWTLKVDALADLANKQIKPALLVLLGAVGFVLLIACANVANLMLARGAVRAREVAIRAALGGDRWALARPVLAESLVLALFGGALGVLFANLGVEGLLLLAKNQLPRADEIGVNVTVVVFTLCLSVVCGILFGVAPALQGSRYHLQEALKEGGRTGTEGSGRRIRRALIVAEVALALTLLVGAGLLIKSFSRLVGVNPGFDSGNLLTFNLALPQARYPDAPAQRRFFDETLSRIRQLPGVKGAGAATVVPFTNAWTTGTFTVEGWKVNPGESPPWGDIRIVTPGYLETLRVPLLQGRTFEESDRQGAREVAVIDEELARRFFPGRDPIGKRIAFSAEATPKPDEWVDIVGVVGHTKHEGLDAKNRVQVYLPSGQNPIGRGNRGAQLTVTVRTTREPLSAVGDVRAAVRSVDPDIPLARIRTMEQLISDSTGQRRLSLFLLALFAALALGLASIGIYGVMSYNVAQRTREMGIRIALGAERSSVLRLVIGQGMALAGAGIVIGALGGLVLTRVLQGQLYAVRSTDPGTYALVGAIIASVALLASLFPALRATRIDPAVALRDE